MENKTWQILAKYLTNEPLTEQEKTVLNIANNSKEHQEELKDSQRIWESSKTSSEEIEWETDSQWDDLRTKLDKESKVIELTPWYKQYYWQTAAAILILLGVGYYSIKHSLSNKEINSAVVEPIAIKTKEPVQNEIKVEKIVKAEIQTYQAANSVKEIRLPDGSQIWLNKNSVLTHHLDFGKTDRKVTLSGEGFFVIEKDKTKPFIIQAAGTETKVLGTSFNLKAYTADKNVELIVMTGKVEFTDTQNTLEKEILLPKQKIVFTKQGRKINQSTVDNTNFLQWTKPNNATYLSEIRSPKQFILNAFSWKKNGLNQTVVEGTLTNRASIVSYKDIELIYKIYTKKGTEKPVKTITLHQQVLPGQSITYKYNLGNMFGTTARVTVDVKNAAIVH